MAQFIQKPDGEKVTLESQGFADLETAGQAGFSPVSAPITTEDLEPASSLDFQEEEPTIIPPIEPPQLTATPAEEEQTAVSEELKKLNLDIAGEAAATTAAEEAAGLEALETTEQDLASQIDTLIAEALQIPLQMQEDAKGRGITVGGLRPLQTARLRTNAIQALGIGALLDATQGKIASAQRKIDRAIDAEFAPLKARRDALLANLAIIQADPATSLQDKNRALAMEHKLNEEAKKEEEAKAVKKAIYDISLLAAQAGADAVTQKAIQDAETEIEATQILVEYQKTQAQSQDELDLLNSGFIKLKPSQLAGINAEAVKLGVDPESLIFRVDNPITGVVDIYKIPKESSFTPTQELKLEQAGLKGASRKEQLDFLFGKTPSGPGPGPTPPEEEPMSINQIEQFRRSYGWTPPFGFSQSQLLQYMDDNPDATPEELEAGAKEAVGKTGIITGTPSTGTITVDELIDNIMKNITDEQIKSLKKKADDAGISSFWKGKKTDVENYLNSIKDTLQGALERNYTNDEIISILSK